MSGKIFYCLLFLMIEAIKSPCDESLVRLTRYLQKKTLVGQKYLSLSEVTVLKLMYCPKYFVKIIMTGTKF